MLTSCEATGAMKYSSCWPSRPFPAPATVTLVKQIYLTFILQGQDHMTANMNIDLLHSPLTDRMFFTFLFPSFVGFILGQNKNTHHKGINKQS